MDHVRLNLLLVGKTGHGKSETGNTILGRRSFKVSDKMTSVTKVVQNDMETFKHYSLKVIDGPGIKDTDMNAAEDQETAAANMAKALAMCDGGVDAFLFVYNYTNRFSKEEKKALEDLKQIFGQNFFTHLIVVVTMGDVFRDNMKRKGKLGITFHDWCREQTGPFGQLFDDCQERFILLNNMEKDRKAMKKQRKEIIQLADKLSQINGRYTSDAFKEAKDLHERYIIQQKVPILDKKIQETCGCLSADLQTYMEKPNRKLKAKIQKMIAATKTEIQDHDKGTNLLQHLLVLVERIEESLYDIEQLRKLTQELEDTRKANTEWSSFGSFCAGAAGGVAAAAGGVAAAASGVGLWTTLLAFTAPPVAVAVAAGAVAVSGVAAGLNYLGLARK